MKSLEADFFQFSITIAKIFVLDGNLEFFTKFTSSLRSYVLSFLATREATRTFSFC